MSGTSLFNPKKVPEDAQKILEDFDKIVQGILPLNSKQTSKLPDDIRQLSHELTDERDTRRMGYMNEKTFLSAYTRYFAWWNLVRLTRLFSNIDITKINLSDGDFALDIGSGPLTVVIALWLSRPELRTKKITWYCLDLSKEAMALGEELFLSIVAKTISAGTASDDNSDSKINSDTDINSETRDIAPWKIIRVKGALGTSIKEKAKLITCANMFNEVFQSETKPLDFLSKKYSEDLSRYAKEDAAFIIVEPGVPRSARFISCLRDSFMRRGLSIEAPCCHCELCPMDGRLLKGPHTDRGSENKKSGKWCNFAFPTKNAPEKLQKLSAAAKLPKDRAVLSFVFATPEDAGITNDVLIKHDVPSSQDKSAYHSSRESLQKPAAPLLLRIASDPIRIRDKIGFYACSRLGLALYIPKKGQLVFSGDLIETKSPNPNRELKRDFKTGAVIVEEN